VIFDFQKKSVGVRNCVGVREICSKKSAQNHIGGGKISVFVDFRVLWRAATGGRMDKKNRIGKSDTCAVWEK